MEIHKIYYCFKINTVSKLTFTAVCVDLLAQQQICWQQQSVQLLYLTHAIFCSPT